MLWWTSFWSKSLKSPFENSLITMVINTITSFSSPYVQFVLSNTHCAMLQRSQHILFGKRKQYHKSFTKNEGFIEIRWHLYLTSPAFSCNHAIIDLILIKFVNNTDTVDTGQSSMFVVFSKINRWLELSSLWCEILLIKFIRSFCLHYIVST